MSAQQDVKSSAPFAIFGWHRHLHLYNGREQFSFRSSTLRPSCKPLLIIAKHNFTLKLRRPPEECAASCNLAPQNLGNESALPMSVLLNGPAGELAPRRLRSRWIATEAQVPKPCAENFPVLVFVLSRRGNCRPCRQRTRCCRWSRRSPPPGRKYSRASRMGKKNAGLARFFLEYPDPSLRFR